jgi:hypothetical protein
MPRLAALMPLDSDELNGRIARVSLRLLIPGHSSSLGQETDPSRDAVGPLEEDVVPFSMRSATDTYRVFLGGKMTRKLPSPRWLCFRSEAAWSSPLDRRILTLVGSTVDGTIGTHSTPRSMM